MGEVKWFKGNIHTHTTESDGDAEPEKVVSWYRRHGYDFLVLSDHNRLTVFEYGESKRRLRRPLLILGEEVTVPLRDGTGPVHLGGIGISRLVEPIDAGEVVPTMQANVDAIRRAGGIACIYHPNYKWAFDHEAINQVTGASLLEVYNGVLTTNVYGGVGKPSYDEIWDGVLGAGRVIFGVATDDSHHYGDFAFDKANPGRGWVVVRAPELSEGAIVNSLAIGDFYSSTGVELSELEASQEHIRLKIEQKGTLVYTTRFTGRKGTLLAEVAGTEPEYRMRGDEGYVRGVVHASGGIRAWTQPVHIKG
jgi:hypothetical protein